MADTLGVQFGRIWRAYERENCCVGTSFYRQTVVGIGLYECYKQKCDRSVINWEEKDGSPYSRRNATNVSGW